MNNHPAVSVVIPCYNEAHTLEGLLNAVHASPVGDKQVIVVLKYGLFRS